MQHSVSVTVLSVSTTCRLFITHAPRTTYGHIWSNTRLLWYGNRHCHAHGAPIKTIPYTSPEL